MNGNDFFNKVFMNPPFSKMHPSVGAFFKKYLSNEKVIEFNGRYVLNTHFPPYPGEAFDNLAAQFMSIGETSERSLYSVTLAVTNRCMYNCWHCYNSGREQTDVPLAILRRVIGELKEMNTVRMTFSGGEPLLRKDLEEIIGSFDNRTTLNLNTTGFGLTAERARALKKSGLFALGVSIDSTDPDTHDRMRGRKGAFDTAVKAVALAAQEGFYPYIISVATHDYLKPDNFDKFIKFADECGAREVHLLEPCATGTLSGNKEALLDESDRQRILDYQKEISRDESLPILSSFLYLESPEAFGCGAGITHLYIDGGGEVSPCNLVPISFGNIRDSSLADILAKMGAHFCKPRTACVGHTLAEHLTGYDKFPIPPEKTEEICKKHLPKEHDVPEFFSIKSLHHGKVGGNELRGAYNRVHSDYDEFWVSEAGAPVAELIERLALTGKETVFEAGCGTGFATALIAAKSENPSRITAADLSSGMLGEAKKRAAGSGFGAVKFIEGDALEIMEKEAPFDLIFTSWVLGYIPLKPFFKAAYISLKKNGRLAFIVHRENSPREPMEIFRELVADDPSILEKQVEFDFPSGASQVKADLASAGFSTEHLIEDKIVFRYDSPEKVLEHLLKSGAGTAFYEAVAPLRQKEQERKFIEILRKRNKSKDDYRVAHDYVACVAVKE